MENKDERMNADFLYLVCTRKDGKKYQMILPSETNVSEFIPKLMKSAGFSMVDFYKTKDWEYLYNFRWFIKKTFGIESLI